LEMRPNIGPVKAITSEEVEQAMLKMKMRKKPLDQEGFQLR